MDGGVLIRKGRGATVQTKVKGVRILLVDHHDSYTHILGHLLHHAGQRLGCAVELDIVPHDCPSWQAGRRDEVSRYQLVVLSPGPGNPLVEKDVGISVSLLQESVPVWGVCLGHQLMAVSQGAHLHPDHAPHHGVVSQVRHHGDGIWQGVASQAQVVRYHSLAVEEPLPDGVEATAWAEDGTVMSLQYESAGAPRWGVQFHPESIDSTCGLQVAMNVLTLAQRWWREQDEKDVANASVVDGLTAVQLAEVMRGALQEGESFRWLDDSLGETTSLMAICGEPGGLPAVTPTTPPYPYSGWIGVLPYEEDVADFAHTRVVAWGSGTRWQVAGEDSERVAVLRRRAAALGSAACRTGVEKAEETDSARVTETFELASTSGALALSPGRYRRSFAECQQLLACGESYEVCLTDVLRLPRRLTRDPWEAYLSVRRACPTSFGAFMECADGPVEAIVSASPELFLQVSTDGTVTTRPMKGTAARCHADPVEHHAQALHLQQDPKTRAENLMVIDMARSDLARVCQPGTVTVPKDRVVESYRTVHQLVTEVTGRLRPECGAVEAIRACFPPASMTGAPKERTVQLLRDIERQPRGIYSGTLGFLGDDGSASLSVVIRSAYFTRTGDVFIGAGGAITAESSCSDEYAEMLHKASYVVGAVLDPGAWTPRVVDSFYLCDGLFAQQCGDEVLCGDGAQRGDGMYSTHWSHHDDGGRRARELHQQRFVAGVQALYGATAAAEAAEFYAQCCAALPTTGEFFPQIWWDATGGSAQLSRPCPPRLTHIVGLIGSAPRFTDRYAQLVLPHIKGPDMPAYGELRALAAEEGAQEVVLMDRWGMVREGSHSAILWWDGNTLCGPPHDAVMPSTMRQLIEEEARAEGYAVEERWLAATELPCYRVWSVNALHGIREIDRWVE